MSTRYVSYDIGPRGENEDLVSFAKKHNGKALSRSLFRFETNMTLEDFRSELYDAVGDDRSVIVIIRSKEGVVHGRPAARPAVRTLRRIPTRRR
jgi:hypothetical protein